MEQKCYSKQELALEYFPDATPEVASAHLRRWINRCKPLHDVLVKSGYTKMVEGIQPDTGSLHLRLSGRAIGRKSFFRAHLQKKT